MPVAISNCRVKGSTFWFRRAIPADLSGLFGQKEITCSVRTKSRREAGVKLRLIWNQTEHAFDRMKAYKIAHDMGGISITPSQIVDEVKLGIRRIVEGKAILDWQGAEPRQQAEKREQAPLQPERNNADADTRGYIKPSPMLTDKLEDYLSVRRLPGKNGKRTPEKSIRDVRVAVRLFEELVGCKPVREYSKEDAFRFQMTLMKLPKVHGKDSHAKGAVPKTASELIAENEQALVKRPTMEPKTIKKHFSSLSGYWRFLKGPMTRIAW